MYLDSQCTYKEILVLDELNILIERALDRFTVHSRKLDPMQFLNSLYKSSCWTDLKNIINQLQ